MERQRWVDRLVGAGVTLLVLVLLVVVALWAVSRPAGGGPDALPTTTATPDPDAGATGTAVAPTDLEPGEIWTGDLVLDAGVAATTEGMLRDVRAVGRGVRTGADAAVAEHLSVDATVPFGVVAEQMGDADAVIRAHDDDEATIERTVEVAGRAFDVVATGTVEVRAGRLVVEPTSIDLGGPDFLGSLLASVVRPFVTIEHEVEGLPEGLVLQGVVVQDDGFRAHLEGTDVRLDLASASP